LITEKIELNRKNVLKAKEGAKTLAKIEADAAKKAATAAPVGPSPHKKLSPYGTLTNRAVAKKLTDDFDDAADELALTYANLTSPHTQEEMKAAYDELVFLQTTVSSFAPSVTTAYTKVDYKKNTTSIWKHLVKGFILQHHSRKLIPICGPKTRKTNSLAGWTLVPITATQAAAIAEIFRSLLEAASKDAEAYEQETLQDYITRLIQNSKFLAWATSCLISLPSKVVTANENANAMYYAKLSAAVPTSYIFAVQAADTSLDRNDTFGFLSRMLMTLLLKTSVTTLCAGQLRKRPHMSMLGLQLKKHPGSLPASETIQEMHNTSITQKWRGPSFPEYERDDEEDEKQTHKRRKVAKRAAKKPSSSSSSKGNRSEDDDVAADYISLSSDEEERKTSKPPQKPPPRAKS
jgi:hypothetical protein